MLLKGWINDLPPHLEEAVERGELAVVIDPKTKGEYLVGEIQHAGYTLAFPLIPGIGGEQHLFMLKQIAQLKVYP